MRLHSKAKTTPVSRELIINRVVRDGWSVQEVADAQGISGRTVWKWLARYREEGAAGLQDRSSRPASSPARTPERRERRIEKLRRSRLSAFQIAQQTKMPRSTVSAVLVRLGLSRLRALDPKEPANRYEHEHPGDMLHVDIKKLGRFNKIGKRIRGDHITRSAGAGWEYVHVCVDDHSRVAYVEVLPNEKSETAIGFMRRAVSWFSELGVRTHRVLSDNGPCYVSKDFKACCESLDIKNKRTRPYRPRTNGKAERFIQTILKEWAYQKPYQTSAGRRRALPYWLAHYNRVRLHGGIGHQAPMSRIKATE